MKNKGRIITLVFVLIIIILSIIVFINTNNKSDNKKEETKVEEKENNKQEEKETEEKEEPEVTPQPETPIVEKNNYVSYNGFLKLNGTSLVNEKGEPIILKGMSSHGIQWFGDLVTKENLTILKNEWHTNVFRIAMYTNENGYISNPNIKNKVYSIIDELISMDMYVIVDWHILSDGNPLQYKEQAKSFFNEVTSKYSNVPNIIYEICNEPNNTSMDNVYNYANEVIPIIQKNSPKSIIIVGTTTWSQDVDQVNKLNYDNVLYALHFYSGTHKDFLRQKATTALNKGTPIFVTEFGVSDASGNGGIFLDEANKWISYLKEKQISIVAWSLSNKNESSAVLRPGTTVLKDENLSEAGKYLKNIFITY